MKPKTKIDERYVHSALSYQIIGILFEVYNSLGHGHAEKTYQRAIAVALKKSGIKCVEQLYVPRCL